TAEPRGARRVGRDPPLPLGARRDARRDRARPYGVRPRVDPGLQHGPRGGAHGDRARARLRPRAIRPPAARRPPRALRAGPERGPHLPCRPRHSGGGSTSDRSMIMPTSPLAVLGLGFVLGLRHALDVDHLAAVSTIVSQRRSLWRSSLVGALWGLGHT